MIIRFNKLNLSGLPRYPLIQKSEGEIAMATKARLGVSKEKIEDFCKRHHIRKLSFFGSVLKGDFSPGSDVDVLVEFEPGQVVGFLRLAAMEIELSKILNRKVDLRTPAELSRYFRQEVLDLAEVQYAGG
jgi:predicted nucleotidyltransferase